MNQRMGELTFHSSNIAYIQLSHDNELTLQILYDGIQLSVLEPGYSWNGTIPANKDVYLKWSFTFLMPHEENFMLFAGIAGAGLLFFGFMLVAYSFKKYPFFTLQQKDTVWETDIFMYSLAIIIFGAGLLMTWLLA